MQPKRHITALIFFLGILTGTGILFRSCESVLFIDLEEGVKLIVLNGALTDTSRVEVQVSRTRHILDNAPLVPLEQATVRLYGDGSELETLTYQGNGYYGSMDIVPETGIRYAIEVENAGYPPVHAECTIPREVPILGLDTATMQAETYWGGTDSFLQFDLTLEDPAGEDNFYLVSAWSDRARTEYRGDTTVILADSVFVDGQWVLWVRDSTYALFDIKRYAQYTYIQSEDIIVEGGSSDGLLFSDQLIDGKSYSFRGRIQTIELGSADSTLLEIRLNSISEDYYKYLKSRQEHYIARDQPLSVPVIVYSNVVDGTGFLGGVSSDRRTITTFVPEYSWDYYYFE